MAYLSIILFACLYAAAASLRAVPHWAGAAYLLASGLCFALYARDKAAARADSWRISEHTLLLLGLACGWPGAVLAQRWLRHKSRKPAFQLRFWLTVLLNAGAFVFLIWS